MTTPLWGSAESENWVSDSQDNLALSLLNISVFQGKTVEMKNIPSEFSLKKEAVSEFQTITF